MSASSAAAQHRPPTHHHALFLDVRTLSLLLQRNQHQHRRCIYYRRMSMALSALRRIISRIAHATVPVLHEISRGHFVPFLTVALGCLGRLHSLLTRMGREVASVLREAVPQLRGLHYEGRKTGKTNRIKESRGIVDWKLLEDLIMTPFVVENARDNDGQERQSTSNNEWNDLMEHFVDISQDKLTANINDYVKRKRWSGAVSRFGLGKFVLGSNASTPSLEHIPEGLQEALSTEREDSAFEDDRVNRYPTRELETNAMCSDTGELMNIKQSCGSTTQSKVPAGAPDENMARIRKERMKRHIMEIPSPETSAQKKKRKKTKRRKSSIDNLMGDDDQKLLRRDHADGTESTEKSVASARTDFLSESGPHEAHTNRRSNTISELTLIVTNQYAAILPDSIGTDFAERNNTPKKKSKTGKKKKRKSTSVIDDIFKR
ncbi:hypothetical protein ACHAW5_001817 [Stephanodiscus triporus]|uniref:Nucleolus and neural progenitor protein-like N-terminal domain-containing protein n=1 Tax=Stephanodiscus triporus TaxID=2934178 RepID=A0ABD3NLA2_9STRA